MNRPQTTNVTIDDEEYECTYRYYSGFKGTYYEPPEPPEIDILEMKPDIILTDKQFLDVEKQIFEELEERE